MTIVNGPAQPGDIIYFPNTQKARPFLVLCASPLRKHNQHSQFQRLILLAEDKIMMDAYPSIYAFRILTRS